MKARIIHKYDIPYNSEKIIPLDDGGLACVGFNPKELDKKKLIILRDGNIEVINHQIRARRLRDKTRFEEHTSVEVDEGDCALVKSPGGFVLMNAAEMFFFDNAGSILSRAGTRHPLTQIDPYSRSYYVAAPVRGVFLDRDRYLMLLPNYAAMSGASAGHVGGGLLLKYLNVKSRKLKILGSMNQRNYSFEYEKKDFRIKYDETNPRFFRGEEMIHPLIICDAIEVDGKIHFHTIGNYSYGYASLTYSRYCRFKENDDYEILRELKKGFAKFSSDKKYLINRHFSIPKNLSFLNLQNDTVSELHITPKKVLGGVDKHFRLFDSYDDHLWLACGTRVTQLQMLPV